MGKGYPSDWSSRRKKVLNRDNHRCQRCGARGGSNRPVQLHVHHKTPKSKGGSHHPRNLVTLCRDCHQKQHDHGVGGRPTAGSNSSGTTSSGNEEIDPQALIGGLAVIVILAAIVLTGTAIGQVTPNGQTTTQSYELDYHLVKDDSDGSGTEYVYYNGPPLLLDITIHDNSIPKDEEVTLTVRIANPADHHLRGEITAKRYTGYDDPEPVLFTIDYDLPPESQDSKTITVDADRLYSQDQSLSVTSELSLESEIWSEGYKALHPETQTIGNDKITVRKQLTDRFGFYWLCLLVTVFTIGGIAGLKRYWS